jgi:hypothetical protein
MRKGSWNNNICQGKEAWNSILHIWKNDTYIVWAVYTLCVYRIYTKDWWEMNSYWTEEDNRRIRQIWWSATKGFYKDTDLGFRKSTLVADKPTAYSLTFFLEVLGFVLRASHLLGMNSICQSFFVLGIFANYLLRLASNCIPPPPPGLSLPNNYHYKCEAQ